MASTGGYCQMALEQAPNYESGANAVSSVVLYHPHTEIGVDPKPEPLERNDELRGGFYASPHSGAASYAPEGTFDERMYPATVGQWLYAANGGDTVTQGVAGPTVVDPDAVQIPAGVYRHVFSLNATEIPQTLQAIWAPPAGGFWKAQGLGVDELSFKRDKGAWWLAAKVLGLISAPISDPSLTPAYETAAPWREGQMALTWLSGSAVTEEFDWSLKNGLKTEYSFQHASLYPDSIVYEAPLPTLGGTIAKRSLDADDWAALVAGTTFAAKLHYTHSTDAVSGYKHQLWVEMPACQYVSAKPDAVKNERRNKASFDWEARYDTVTSKWFTITLCNTTPTYATYA